MIKKTTYGQTALVMLRNHTDLLIHIVSGSRGIILNKKMEEFLLEKESEKTNLVGPEITQSLIWVLRRII